MCNKIGCPNHDPVETMQIIDDLIATEAGRKLIQARWKHAQDSAKAKAEAERKAQAEARKNGPGPMIGWDCWVCGWEGDRPESVHPHPTLRCPGCHCLHGLRRAQNAWTPHRW